MTHSSETEIFLGWSEWESFSPRPTSDMPSWQKSRLPYKKLTFGPNIQIFGSKKHILFLAANWSSTGQCFQHNKGVLLAPWYEDTKSFTPSPQKLDFRQNLAQNWHFWQYIGLLGPFNPIPHRKTMRTSCLGDFYVKWLTKFLLTPIKVIIFVHKRPNLAQNWLFLAKYWHFWPIWSHAHVGGCSAGCNSQDTYLLYDGHITHILIYSTVDCQWKWTDWSDCTTTCERGTTTRLQNILQQAMYGGALCPNKTSETKDCNTDICCPGEF